MIKGLHHNAYHCRDAEETRGFHEDFLGLRFVSALPIDGRRALHRFFGASTGAQQEIMDPSVSKPHEALSRWRVAKPNQLAAA